MWLPMCLGLRIRGGGSLPFDKNFEIFIPVYLLTVWREKMSRQINVYLQFAQKFLEPTLVIYVCLCVYR